MTHTYSLQGITCDGCVAKVKAALQGVAGVTRAEVTLTPPVATVSMSTHIPTTVLAKAVASSGAYALTDSMGHASAMEAEDGAVAGAERTKDSFLPIYLIFGYVAGVATLVQFVRGAFDPMAWMGHFMAGFFLVFSFFKLLDVRGFAEGYSTYDVVAKRLPSYGLIYPFIELALGIAYLVAPLSVFTNAATFVVMGVSSVGVIQQVLKNSPFQCACLGTIFKLPLSKVTLVEDLLMVAMSAATLVMLSVA
ncbi:MAG: cation transporter [Flavobacteriales bacterium]|nr:cation transporter [Flavobacteriales bacterium]